MKLVYFLMFLGTINQAFSQQGEWPENVRNKPKGCVMGGICYRFHDDSPRRKTLNCLSDDEDHPEDRVPRRFSNITAIERLREFCGDTLDFYGEEPEGGYDLCCEEEQIAEMADMELVKNVVARCPTCWRNFRQLFCELACSPYQIHVLRAATIEDTPGNGDEGPPRRKRMVRELEVYHTPRYAHETYESCKEVKMGEEDTPVMEFLCGPYGASRCSPENWFQYMGDYRNSYTPFHIYFKSDGGTDMNITAFDGITYNCNATWPGDESRPCSCRNCETAVGQPRPRPPRGPLE